MLNGVADVSYADCSRIALSGLFDKATSSFIFYAEDYYNGLKPIVTRRLTSPDTFEFNHSENISTMRRVTD